MSFIFVNKDDEVKVNLSMGVSKDNPKIVYADIELAELKNVYPDLDLDSIQEHSFVFRLPTYGDNGEITSKAIELGEDGLRLNLAALRINRIVTLLKSWTLIDEQGKPVKISAENIKNLHPNIANMLGMGLELKLTELKLA